MYAQPPSPVKHSALRTRRFSWKRLWNWGRFFIGFLGLVLVTYSVSRTDALLDTFLSVDMTLVFIALLLNLFATLVKTVRWWLVLRASNIDISIQRLFGTYLVGTFFSQFMPGSSMGGDAMRMMELGADSGRMIASVSSVMVERAIGLLTVFISASVILFFFPNPELPITFKAIIYGVTVIGVIALIVLKMGWFIDPIVAILTRFRLKKVADKVLTLSKALQGHFGNVRLLGEMVGLSFIANACTMSATYLGLMSVDHAVNFFAFIPLISLAVAVELIPLSPGALGLREATYVFLMSLLDVTESAALTTALIVRGIAMAQALLGGFILIARAFESRAARANAQNEMATDV
jgi:glycosyltransferase 2 family protein